MITATYEELFTFENIYKAHMRSRMCRRDKRPVVRFEMNMLSGLYDLYRRLNDGTFRFGKYCSFNVYEPKCREIQTLCYSDRIIQHVLCDNVLMPYFSNRVVIDNCVCQKGKGAHFALSRFEKMIRKYVNQYGAEGYFFKCDILKYFATIPHDRLKRAICGQIGDPRIRTLVESVIDGYHTKPEYLARYNVAPLGKDNRTERGIPIGNQTSQVFGMYYLDPVDRMIKEQYRVKVYSRYMDDFVLVHHDLEYLRSVRAVIYAKVEELGLALNSKTQIFPMRNGVTYLGYRYRVLSDGKLLKTVKKQTKRRFRWRVRLLKKAYLDGLIDEDRVQRSRASIMGHLSHGKNRKFERELNHKFRFLEQEPTTPSPFSQTEEV